MSEALNAKIHVFNMDSEGEIASPRPVDLQKEDVDHISHITNLIVLNLQDNLKTKEQNKAPNSLELSEVELTFGIDIGVEAKTNLTFPIIGPLFSGGAKAGATFQVHIKLSRNIE